jgi:uncharacterized protein (DUF3820 family)
MVTLEVFAFEGEGFTSEALGAVHLVTQAFTRDGLQGEVKIVKLTLFELIDRIGLAGFFVPLKTVVFFGAVRYVTWHFVHVHPPYE